MKKFYSTALAALCALGVSATINLGELRTEAPVKVKPQERVMETPAPRITENLTISKEVSSVKKNVLPKFDTSVKKSDKTAASGQIVKMEKIAGPKTTAKPAKALTLKTIDNVAGTAKKACNAPQNIAPLAEGEDADVDYSSIEGEYTIYIGDYYFQSGVGATKARATITQDGSEITISSDYFVTDVTAAYDEETGAVTFSRVRLGAMNFDGGQKFYVRFDPFYVDNATEKIEEDSYSAIYDTTDGTLSFPAKHGFSWRVFKDSRYTTNAGEDTSKPVYAGLFDVEGMDRSTFNDDNGDVDYSVVEGEYTIQIGDWYKGEGKNKGSFNQTATITRNGDMIRIDCDYFQTPVYAAYDEATQVITFKQLQFGEVKLTNGENVCLAFDPFYWDYELKTVVASEYEVKYSTSNGSIAFPADHGFSWSAYNDETYAELLGRFDIFDVEGMNKKGGNSTGIAGNYTIYIGDYYFQDSVGPFTETATITQDGNVIVIECDYFQTPVYAAYDESTNVITFKQLQFGEVKLTSGATCYIAFEPFHWDNEIEEVVYAEYEAEYNNGTITFPTEHGFAWVRYDDEEYTDYKGVFDIFEVEGMVKEDAPEEPELNWTLIGTGVFYNNVASRFAKIEDAPYEVEVYQGVENANMYKVADAWCETYSVLNIVAVSPDLVLDATDPNNVLIPVSSLGIGNQTNGVYLISNYGYLAGEEEVLAFTTLKEDDSTIVFTFEPKSLWLMSEVNGILGYINAVDNTLIINKNGGSTGIEDVEASENAPVEYFNLQGVRIDAPAAGQVVIKRQGSNVTKTLVR